MGHEKEKKRRGEGMREGVKGEWEQRARECERTAGT